MFTQFWGELGKIKKSGMTKECDNRQKSVHVICWRKMAKIRGFVDDEKTQKRVKVSLWNFGDKLCKSEGPGRMKRCKNEQESGSSILEKSGENQ